MTTPEEEVKFAIAEFNIQESIYIASKIKHVKHWQALRTTGVNIISTWIDTIHLTNKSDLWRRCIDEASKAEYTIVYRESDEIFEGALLEIGAALAHNKQVILVGEYPTSYTFIYHPNVYFGGAFIK